MPSLKTIEICVVFQSGKLGDWLRMISTAGKLLYKYKYAYMVVTCRKELVHSNECIKMKTIPTFADLLNSFLSRTMYSVTAANDVDDNDELTSATSSVTVSPSTAVDSSDATLPRLLTLLEVASTSAATEATSLSVVPTDTASSSS